MNSLLILILASCFIDSIMSDQCCVKEVKYQFLEYVTYDQCEGKDSGNYTLINQFTRDQVCSERSNRLNDQDLLFSCSIKQNKANELRVLSGQLTPNGAMVNVETIYAVLNGPLEGKYVYQRESVQEPQFLKICSSILSYTYVSSKTNVLLIADKLDLNVLISSDGAFDLFKKGCTTICHGRAIVVGPTLIREKDIDSYQY